MMDNTRRTGPNSTHGMSKTKFYAAWQAMKKRCSNPAHKDFHSYGGRGIKVCERWMNFENFLADMGLPPPGMTLDRIDNNGDYEPSNCRWATPAEQALNTNRAVVINVHGVPKRAREIAAELGVTPHAIWGRIKRGMSHEAAATTPSMRKRRATTTKAEAQ